MNTRTRALRQHHRDPVTPPAAPCASAQPMPARERRAGDAVQRSLARWFGDSAAHAVVPGDK